MKKLIFFLFCFTFGAMGAFAQSTMTNAELQFRNSIENFLKVEGFVPTIDNEDNSLNFKKEGTKYWITVEGESPYYIELHEGGFTLDNTNKDVMLDAVNNANRTMRAGKAILGTMSVRFATEFYCNSIYEFKNTFYDNMNCVNNVRKAVKDYYNDHNN